MKKAFQTWVWCATVLTRSLLSISALAVFLGLWGLAAYGWLWLSESSALVLLLGLVGAVGLVLAAAAALAGTMSSALEVAAGNAQALSPARLVRFGGKRFGQSLLWLVAAAALGSVLAGVCAWVSQSSLELASFLTFHLQVPVSYLLISRVFTLIEGLIWIAAAGVLLSILMALFASRSPQARRPLGETLLGAAFQTPFLTSLLSVVVFGGSAYCLAQWRPLAPAGFWDYLQLCLRAGSVLILLAAGWLFWLLGLARLNSPRAVAPASEI